MLLGQKGTFMEHLYHDRIKTAFRFLYTNTYRYYVCICIYIYVPLGSSLLNTIPNRNIYIPIYVYTYTHEFPPNTQNFIYYVLNDLLIEYVESS